MVSNLDGHVTIAPCMLISKNNEIGAKSKKDLLEARNNAWQGMARKFAPGYSNYHIWKGKVLHNHN